MMNANGRTHAACGALLIALALLAASRAHAQTAARTDTTAVPWSALTMRPMLRDSVVPSAGIRFPLMLRAANIEGEVDAELVVDDSGRVASVRIRKSSHDLFTAAVRIAVKRWTLTAPMLDGRNVRAAVPLHVVFELPGKEHEPTTDVSELKSDSVGFVVRLGWHAVPRDTTVSSDRTTRHAVMFAGLRMLARLAPSDTGRVTCVSAHNVLVDKAESEAVVRDLLSAVPSLHESTHCPPTYYTTIVEGDRQGRWANHRPAGAVDPATVELNEAYPWTSDIWMLRGSINIGAMWQLYVCEVRRTATDAPWQVNCEQRGISMSFQSSPGVMPSLSASSRQDAR